MSMPGPRAGRVSNPGARRVTPTRAVGYQSALRSYIGQLTPHRSNSSQSLVDGHPVARHPHHREAPPVTMRYMYVDYPAPDLDGLDPCEPCQGAGTTGEMYAHAGGNGITLVIDILCPACGGCGRAEHTECEPEAHGTTPAGLTAARLAPPDPAAILDGHPVPDDPDTAAFVLPLSVAYLDDADETAPWIGHPDGTAPCPACEGRQWTAVPALTGKAPDTRVITFRVPCGCAEGRARELDAGIFTDDQ